MEKENFNNKKSDRLLLSQKKKYFLGSVVLRDISKIIHASDQKAYYVAFRNGARTKVHQHEGGQILVVMEGNGSLVLYKKFDTKGKRSKIKQTSKSTLKTGDIVYITKNTLHWHGALYKKDFVHIAFNAFTSRGKESKTIWYDSDFHSYSMRIP